MKPDEDIYCVSINNKVDQYEIIREVYDMAIPSLSPDRFLMFENCLYWLCKARGLDTNFIIKDKKK